MVSPQHHPRQRPFFVVYQILTTNKTHSRLSLVIQGVQGSEAVDQNLVS